MIEIISGTDRPNSMSRKIADHVANLYIQNGDDANVIDLKSLNFAQMAGGKYSSGPEGEFKEAIQRLTKADGIVFVVPEYNGSFPGALKTFIDFWQYPQTFEFRPFAFIGLGFRWGGLRPVEHLQQVIGYRNGYAFPIRVFISNIKNAWGEQGPTDPQVEDILNSQTRDFSKFIRALKTQGLDANSRIS